MKIVFGRIGVDFDDFSGFIQPIELERRGVVRVLVFRIIPEDFDDEYGLPFLKGEYLKREIQAYIKSREIIESNPCIE